MRILVLAWLSLLATGAGSAAAPQPSAPLAVRGQLALPAAAERPTSGQIVVELRDLRADRVLAEQRLPLADTQPTQAFHLRLPRERLPRGHGLSLRGALFGHDGEMWLSEPVAIDPAAASVDLGTLPLVRAPRPLAFQTRIDCGLRQFVIGMAGDTLTLRDGEQSFALQPSAADPDQHLVAVGDASTSVQLDGTTATVTVRGVSYAGCSLLR